MGLRRVLFRRFNPLLSENEAKKGVVSDVTCASAFPQLMSSQLGSIRSLVSHFVSNRHETEMKDPGQLFSCMTGVEVGKKAWGEVDVGEKALHHPYQREGLGKAAFGEGKRNPQYLNPF